MFHKISLASFFSMMLFVGLLGLSDSAQAASTCTPVVNVQETKETFVKLKVTCLNLKNTKAKIKILVSNDDTDSDSYKSATATLGKNGSVNLKISGLDSATNYNFKVKVKKASSSIYSSYSGSVSTTTEGSDYDPVIDKINGITEDSAKLKISCDDLENKTVDVQVAYKKKTSWSTKNFSLTLDDDGEGSITMDDLKSDTLYSLKIRIRKEGNSSYSVYSPIKTVTTDED